MKKLGIVVILAFVVLAGTSCVNAEVPLQKDLSISPRDVKVMTYNVHNGIGLDKIRDHARIAEIIRGETPDIVGIQEVDSATLRSGNSYVLGEIAEHAGMIPIYAPAIDFDGGRYGIGMLVKEMPDSISRIPLPGREESRMALIAWFKDIVVVNTHLSLTAEDAAASVGIIRDILKSTDKPMILIGDLNSMPQSPVIHALNANFKIVSPQTPTFPANKPTVNLDYIMVSRGSAVSATDARVIGEKVASDHLPVAVTLNISK